MGITTCRVTLGSRIRLFEDCAWQIVHQSSQIHLIHLFFEFLWPPAIAPQQRAGMVKKT